VDTAYADRALGCLLRGGVGDDFGYEVEFDSVAVIRAEFGDQGIQEPSLYDGRLVISDDMQMTPFTLESLLRADAVYSPSPTAKIPKVKFYDTIVETGRTFAVNDAAGPRSAVFLRLGQSSQTDEANILA
jgi:ADP-ribosylglycohydrolase